MSKPDTPRSRSTAGKKQSTARKRTAPKTTSSKKTSAKKAAPKQVAARKSSPRPASRSSFASRTLLDSAQQLLHAGSKTLGRAQQEGSRLFEALLREGLSMEKKTRKLASETVEAVGSQVGQVRERAADTWDRLETLLEKRVQQTLLRMGVPSREDVRALNTRVDELNRHLRRLDSNDSAAPKGKTTRRPRKTAAKKARPAKAGTTKAGAAKATTNQANASSTDNSAS